MKFNGFLSYSHAADNRLAPAVQSALHRFGCPWYHLRSMWVFRDKTGLSATPALWPKIESALSESDYFLLMASPEAAASRWVRRETEWWLKHRSVTTLLILLTDGELLWSQTAGDFDWFLTNALPHELIGQFAHEPLWVDLRWARSAEKLSLRDAQFRGAILDLSAAILDKPKEALDGEDLRVFRRNRKAAAAALVVSLLLAIIATVSALVANRQRLLAQDQTKTANSRRLAATALLTKDDQLDLASLLAVEAKHAANTFEARSSLFTIFQTNPRLLTYLSHPSPVESVAFSPNGKVLAVACYDASVWFWDTQTRKPLGINPHGYRGDPKLGPTSHDLSGGRWSAANRVAFSPDGKTVASTNHEHAVFLWDAEAQRLVGSPLQLPGHVLALAFSPDGRVLAASSDREVWLWNVQSRQPAGDPLNFDNSSVLSIAFSPDGSFLAAGTEDSVQVWDISSRRALQNFETGGYNLSVAFSPDNTMLAAGSSDNNVYVWDTANWRSGRKKLTGHSGGVTSIAFSADGMLASASDDETVRLWNVAEEKLVGEPLRHRRRVWRVAFSSGGVLASASDDQMVALWAPAKQQFLQEIPQAEWVVFSPNGKLLAVADDFGTRVLKLPLRDAQTAFHLERCYHPIGFSPDSKILACMGSSRIAFFDASDGHHLDGDLLGDGNLDHFAFSPDGRVVAASGDHGVIQFWDLATRQRVGQSIEGAKGVVAFSNDGKLLLFAIDGFRLQLWSLGSRKAIGNPLKGGVGAVSPDGRTIASGTDDQSVRLWDVSTGQPIGEGLYGHTQIVDALAFSADGELLASGDWAGSVRLWDVATRRPFGGPLTPASKTTYVWSVAFSPDRKLLVAGGVAASQPSAGFALPDIARVWDTDPESWAENACFRANRNLSAAEWQQYMGDETYRSTCPKSPPGEGVQSGRR